MHRREISITDSQNKIRRTKTNARTSFVLRQWQHKNDISFIHLMPLLVSVYTVYPMQDLKNLQLITVVIFEAVLGCARPGLHEGLNDTVHM